jgi:uncharacterized protein YuzE
MAVTLAPLDVLQVLTITRQSPKRQLFVDYDEEVDVLYVSFTDPPAMPSNCVEDDNGIITRFGESGEVIGYTYLNASELLKLGKAA